MTKVAVFFNLNIQLLEHFRHNQNSGWNLTTWYWEERFEELWIPDLLTLTNIVHSANAMLSVTPNQNQINQIKLSRHHCLPQGLLRAPPSLTKNSSIALTPLLAEKSILQARTHKFLLVFCLAQKSQTMHYVHITWMNRHLRQNNVLLFKSLHSIICTGTKLKS